MRVSRVRKFKKSREITFIVNEQEIMELKHAFFCHNEDYKCISPEMEEEGKELTYQLYYNGLNR